MQKSERRYFYACRRVLLGAFFGVFISIMNVKAAEDLSYITGAGGVVYFADDFESGYQYIYPTRYGDEGGRFSYMGGYIRQSTAADNEGMGCSDSNIYHNTIISSDIMARGVVPGSLYALKTPYDGDCTAESSSRDITILSGISFGPGEDCYVRWYQKWSNPWNDSPNQHKFTKFYGGYSGATKGMHFSFSGNSRYGRNAMVEYDNQFRSGEPDGTTVWVYADPLHLGGTITGQDNYIRPGGDTDFVFETGQWYQIEMHFRLNSTSDSNDGVSEVWVNGEKIFGCDNIKMWDATYDEIDTFEFQHIYPDHSSVDQPTYMDNIVIADKYIGPVDAESDMTAPADPIGLSVS